MSFRLFRIFLPLALLGAALTTGISTQPLDFDRFDAEEEFRWGVRAFHSGLYNEAILSFSRSLSLQPESRQARLWLGRAYFSSGFEDAALSEWQSLLDAGVRSEHIETLIETLNSRRGITQELSPPPRYAVSGDLTASDHSNPPIRHPAGIHPRPDGSFFLASFATNRVLQIDVNGVVRNEIGGDGEFIQPFDMVELEDGTLAVSEFGADRISRVTPEGRRIATIGSTGVGEGELLGPQFLATDDDGYLYVTDWGNRRVSKYDVEGRFVLSFGSFAKPTGIVYHSGLLYVADAETGLLTLFDVDGNRLAEIDDVGLERPEGISSYDDTTLLIADGERLVLFDIEQRTTRPIAQPGGISRLITGAIDANGTLIAVDFDRSRLLFLSDVSTLYSGLVVRIDRIWSQQFPRVLVDVTVSDRAGRAIVGLNRGNFFLSEQIGAPVDHEMIFIDRERADIALLVEKSMAMLDHDEERRSAFEQLLQGMEGRGGLTVVSAGEQPVLESPRTAGIQRQTDAALSRIGHSDLWTFDAGVRLAGAELLQGAGKRAIVFIGSGRLPDHAFDTFGLEETAQFLRNNGISFHTIYLRPDLREQTLDYLGEATGGGGHWLYRPEGVGAIVDDIVTQREGRYRLRFVSTQNGDLGRAYLPLDVEAYLIQKSGRDSSGYYAPLQ